MPVYVAAVTSKRARRSRRAVKDLDEIQDKVDVAVLLKRAQYEAKAKEEQRSISKDYLPYRTTAAATDKLTSTDTKTQPSTKPKVTFMEDTAGQTMPLSQSNPDMEQPGNISPTIANRNQKEPSPPQTQGTEKSFKRRRSFNSRKRDVEEIVKKHPHKVPIIIERAQNEKTLGLLDKSKFLVPEELTMSQLTTIIRRRLQLGDTQAFYLIVNRRTMVSASMTLAEVYRTDKDSDGFLYITYASQEMFG